jgi:hypothetical protein
MINFDMEIITDLNRYPDSITRLHAFVRSPETKDNLVWRQSLSKRWIQFLHTESN